MSVDKPSAFERNRPGENAVVSLTKVILGVVLLALAYVSPLFLLYFQGFRIH